MEKFLRLVIGNSLMLNSPPPPSLFLIVYNMFVDEILFTIFTQAIKFDCLFLTIFPSFYWFVSFVFTN